MDIEKLLELFNLVKLILMVVVFATAYYFLYNLWNFLVPYAVKLKEVFKWIWDRLQDLWNLVKELKVVVDVIKINTMTAVNSIASLGSSITDIPNKIKRLLPI